MNHAGFEQRLALVRTTLQRGFKLECEKIEPLDYDPDCPFPYNNFVYRVHLSPPSQAASASGILPAGQPGTIAIPAGALSVVIRLSNAAAGLNDENRIQNEVATMSLMRDALQALPTQLIPDVYGWASAAEGQGWILQQFMPGRILDTEFSHMTLDDKTSILHQMAEIISKLQHHPLPGGIDQYGGVGFDDAGDIISGPMTIIRGGPYATYEDYYRDTLRLRLAEADENPVVQGWRRQGLRERVDRFMTHGIGPIMQQVDSRKALIHGDFTTNNLLVDPGTRRLTAVLDFDWAQVSGIGEEFLRSLGDIQGQLPGRLAEDEDQVLLRQALLNGFEPPVPSLPSTFLSAWTIAEAWDAELARCDAQRPSTIRGMAGLSELKWLSDNLCPFLLFNETIAAQRNEEQQANDRDRTEGLLSRFLRHHGY